MAGIWPGGFSLANAVEIGANTANSQGTTLTAHASSTYAMGAWTELTSSNPIDSAWIVVTISISAASGTAVAVDIGVGGSGSEFVVVPTLGCAANTWKTATYSFPLALPAGIRIAARMSSNALSDTAAIQVHLFADTFANAWAGSAIDVFGYQTNLNLGTTVDPGGTANTRGSYAQIASATTHDLAGFFLMFDTQNLLTSSIGVVAWLGDLAIGAAAAEVIFMANVSQGGFLQTAASPTTSRRIFRSRSRLGVGYRCGLPAPRTPIPIGCWA